MTFGQFSFGKKPEAEEPEIKLDEQMTFDSSIPASIRTQFSDVLKLIAANREYCKKEKEKEIAKKITEAQKDLDEIHKGISYFFDDLSSMARQIDSGSKTIKEFKKDLLISKSDFKNSNETHPTPFFLKYVDDIEDTAETLSQSIVAYASHLQPQANAFASSDKQNNNNENQTLYCFLKEQSDAIFRCSTKVSHLISKMSKVRQVLSEKLKINAINFSIDDNITDDSNVQTINTKHQQFLEQRKQKEKRNVDESDIFGNSTVSVKAAATGSKFGTFSFGQNSGFSQNSKISTTGFGQKNDKANPSTANKSSGFGGQ